MPEHQQIQQSKKTNTIFQKQPTPLIHTPLSNPYSIIQRARINPKSLTHADVMQLQRAIGNRAVAQFLSGIVNSSTAHEAPIQRSEIPEEEEKPMQGKFETVQRSETPEEEEPLQGKMVGTVQKQEIPEEEEPPMQGKFVSIQRQEIPPEEEKCPSCIQKQETPEEEEPFQGKMIEPVQRQETSEEEEPLQGKFENSPGQVTCPSCFTSPIVQKQESEEEEKPLQGKMIGTIQRQEIPEEDPLEGKMAETVQRQEIPEEEPLQTKRENNTGMPDNLKAGVESLSGIDMSDVRVHYNSSKPADVGALAYTQGTDIHVASGQEKHLPHEAWHVVQQMQERVKPTMQAKGISINADAALENEADVMGAKAMQMRSADQVTSGSIADATTLEHRGRETTEASRFPGKAIRASGEKERFSFLSTAATPPVKPIQRIISVAGFQAATPATKFHGRGPNITALDAALGTYIGARTSANAHALVIACNGYLGGQHQPARTNAATALGNEAYAEYRLLMQIGNGNAHLIDALLTQVAGNVLSLVQLATLVGVANANSLPSLINIVTSAQIGILVASGAIQAIGAANAHLLVQLIPLANGVAGLPALTALINASGAANIPLLAPMIPLIGGHAQIPTLTAMLIAQVRGADAAFDLARVAGTNGALFGRLCGELPHFQRVAPPGVVPGPVLAAQADYNAAKLVAPLAQLNRLSLQATTAYAAALPFAAPPLGAHAGGIPAGLMHSVQARINAVNVDIAAITGGTAITLTHRTHATQLRNVVIVALNNSLTGLGGIVVPPVFPPAVVAVQNIPIPFDAANNAPSITNISFAHFLTRHTAHYFDFGEIKPDNTQWPTAWAAGASAQVEGQLCALLAALHGGENWLMPGIPLPGQAVAGGTAQIAGLLDGGGPGLRIGQFFPEAGANFHDHDAATMRAINQLV